MGEKLKDNVIMALIMFAGLVAFPWLALNVNPWLLFLVFPVVLGLYKWRGDSFWLTILMGGAIELYCLGIGREYGVSLSILPFYVWLWMYVFTTDEQKEAQGKRFSIKFFLWSLAIILGLAAGGIAMMVPHHSRLITQLINYLFFYKLSLVVGGIILLSVYFKWMDTKVVSLQCVLGSGFIGMILAYRVASHIINYSDGECMNCVYHCDITELKSSFEESFIFWYAFVWALVQYCQYWKKFWKHKIFYFLVVWAIFGVFNAWCGYESYQKGCPAIPAASVTQSETGNNGEAGAI